MNWGKGIAIFLTLFIAFITALGVTLMRANADLESEDYYLQEINYGDEISAQQNAKNIQSKLAVEIAEDGVYVRLKHEGEVNSMMANFTRPDNPELDAIKKANGKTLFIPKDELNYGKYKLKVNWSDGEKDYQLREEIWVK